MNDSSGFDVERIRDYWLVEAKESLQVADHLVEKRDYSYALFFGHLAVEKMLKAIYVVRRRQHPPYKHNLGKLARLVGLEFDETRADQLDLITSFNLEARYPDAKRLFRQRCTPEYTRKQMAIIKEIFSWLHSHLK